MRTLGEIQNLPVNHLFVGVELRAQSPDQNWSEVLPAVIPATRFCDLNLAPVHF
jgi:hypothetical protein